MRARSALLFILLATTTLAGCLGGDEDVDNAIPRAVVSVTAVSGKVDTFLFDASRSTGRNLAYEWDFGDRTTATEATVEHTYEFGSGVYSATLTITDPAGITDVWEEDIKVGDGINLPPIGAFTPSTRYLERNEPLTVDARATTDFEGDPIRYEWDFNHIMTEAEYIEFREAKKDADYDDAATVTVSEGEDGSAKSDPSGGINTAIPDLPDPTRLLNGHKDPGHDHGGGGPPVSLFNGFRTSTDPVFVLEEGFPDATVFYVRLVAYDVKRASQPILSEEIWPVQVVDAKKREYIGPEEITGTFQAGSPSTVQESTPNNEETAAIFDDDRKWTFEIPDPILLMYVNVTWSQPPTSDALANDIDMELESPNGKTRAIEQADTSISLELTRFDELDTGTNSRTWAVDLVARSGFDIQYTATYWARVDLNPFRAIEAPYVEDDAPRDGET